MSIALAQINPIIGDFSYNLEKVFLFLDKADLVIFPELALCGYPPEDLLHFDSFIAEAERRLAFLVSRTKKACIIGVPRKEGRYLYNSAAIIEKGKLIGFQDKRLLPNYDVFYERRYFEPGEKSRLWEICGKKIAVTICEDIWGSEEHYSVDPIADIQPLKPDLLVNISSSPFCPGRPHKRLKICRQIADTLQVPVYYCNQIGGNDSLIFDGHSLIVQPDGSYLAGSGFVEELVEGKPLQSSETANLFAALVLGVRDYFHKQGFAKAALGLSGGIDSAVVACIAKEALGAKHVLTLTMPSRFSSEGSYRDAKALNDNLGIATEQISIEKLFETFLEELAPFFKGRESDTTEENLQARIRGMLLMAFSNKFGYLILSPGNKSEMAMGYTTLYGDLCGGLGVLSDVTKAQVYALAHYINREEEIIPSAIIRKAPSAELRANQKDSDTLPKYEIIDKVLELYVEEFVSAEEISRRENLPLPLVKNLIQKIHFNEYKRRQAPPGLRVTAKAFTVGRRFPIVQHWDV
ncbi:MAG: NAD+ synthase [Chlamydiales bacterium]